MITAKRTSTYKTLFAVVFSVSLGVSITYPTLSLCLKDGGATGSS